MNTNTNKISNVYTSNPPTYIQPKEEDDRDREIDRQTTRQADRWRH